MEKTENNIVKDLGQFIEIKNVKGTFLINKRHIISINTSAQTSPIDRKVYMKIENYKEDILVDNTYKELKEILFKR